VAATITPTCFRFWRDLVYYPAVLLLLAIFDGSTDALFAFVLGVLPLLFVAGVIFSAWSVIIRRRRRNENHVV
jgi:sulfite exporter TauE/SafE